MPRSGITEKATGFNPWNKALQENWASAPELCVGASLHTWRKNSAALKSHSFHLCRKDRKINPALAAQGCFPP
jgi:hypothetical protein